MSDKCTVFILPAGARDIQAYDLMGDKTDEFIYVVDAKTTTGTGVNKRAEPVAELMVTVKTVDNKGNCSWENIKLHEQYLKQLGVKYIGGGYGSPGTAMYPGCKFILADFNGDGEKDIQVYKVENKKMTPIYFIPDLINKIRSILKQRKKIALGDKG